MVVAHQKLNELTHTFAPCQIFLKYCIPTVPTTIKIKRDMTLTDKINYSHTHSEKTLYRCLYNLYVNVVYQTSFILHGYRINIFNFAAWTLFLPPTLTVSV